LRPDIIDNALITLELRNGALASVIANYCTVAQLSPSVELYGSTGTILVNGPQAGYMRFSAGGPLERPEAGELGWVVPTHTGGHQARPLANAFGADSRDPWSTSLGHFVHCLRTGAAPQPSAEMARHTLEVMVKAAEAAETGQAQELATTL